MGEGQRVKECKGRNLKNKGKNDKRRIKDMKDEGCEGQRYWSLSLEDFHLKNQTCGLSRCYDNVILAFFLFVKRIILTCAFSMFNVSELQI